MQVKDQESRILRSSDKISITNFIQLVYPQPVNQFSENKLCQEAPNKGYLNICRIYIKVTTNN